MLEKITEILTAVQGAVWGWGMILLLLGTHIFMTIRTKGIQRKLWKGIRLSVQEDPDAEGEVSQFGALTTALAATIGTGNIVGVGTAIALGGPGAVFWCWLTGVFGIATKYSEALLAVKYRVKTKDGRMQGGAMYALERGLHVKWLGVLFAVFGGFASFGIGCATQVNAIAAVCEENLGIPSWIVGVAVCILTACVIFGGIRSIARVCEKLVPFMAIFYVAGCLIILVINWDFLLPALKAIVTMAFRPGAVAGGLTGRGLMAAMQYGIARGLFSNESGMGSAPIAAAAAQTRNPVRQALVSSTGTFWDTVVVCALTGLVHCFQYYEESGDRYECRHRRRRADFSCLCADSCCGSADPCARHYLFCLFDDPWLGLLWRAVCGIFCRKERTSAVSVSLYFCPGRSSGDRAEPGVDGGGYPQCADGDSEPDRCAAAVQGSGE